ncbi:hypothetical protein L3X38_007899 [Prunus dulcis]|uniref:Protein FAR1-RELATED SEQUENCE n=1 Tax=Prunus dulcis TaxID=3755 RepID=A0AAD4ZVK6_PRUDU|nr:hypothetical protein L3X38_007899 [Prunus dulcis]
MKKCTRSTYKIEEFEEKWKELMKECELANDDWLNSLYDIHSSWVPVYNRDIFHGNSEVKRVWARAIPRWVTHWEVASEFPETKPCGQRRGPKRTISCYGRADPGM